MTAVVILNAVFAVFVVGGIVALLGRAIIADRADSGSPLPPDSRAARERMRSPRRANRVAASV